MDEDSSTLFVILGILIAYLYVQTGLLSKLIEERVAIASIITLSAFFLWFFRRKQQ